MVVVLVVNLGQDKMKRSVFVILALLGLGACAASPEPVNRIPQTTVTVVNTTAYPEFPDIPIPPNVRLLPFQVDFPRRMDELVVKNVTNCVNVSEEARDDRFWARCGENPVDTSSNIFIGFDQTNWNNVNSNFEILKENNAILRNLLSQGNKQRQEWRRLAQQERDRAASERATVEANNPTN